MIHRFHYLKYGLSLVLILVGAKMVLNAWFDAKIIPTEAALLATALVIGGSIVISILKTRTLTADEAAKVANQWWVPGSPRKGEGDGGQPKP